MKKAITFLIVFIVLLIYGFLRVVNIENDLKKSQPEVNKSIVINSVEREIKQNDLERIREILRNVEFQEGTCDCIVDYSFIVDDVKYDLFSGGSIEAHGGHTSLGSEDFRFLYDVISVADSKICNTDVKNYNIINAAYRNLPTLNRGEVIDICEKTKIKKINLENNGKSRNIIGDKIEEYFNKYIYEIEFESINRELNGNVIVYVDVDTLEMVGILGNSL